MKQFLFISFVILLSSPLLALTQTEIEQCSNQAKAGAIEAYKAEVGVVQGSYGIETSVFFVISYENIFEYLVCISDNNEDGESWSVEYLVRVKKDGDKCKIIKVENRKNASPFPEK